MNEILVDRWVVRGEGPDQACCPDIGVRVLVAKRSERQPLDVAPHRAPWLDDGNGDIEVVPIIPAVGERPAVHTSAGRPVRSTSCSPILKPDPSSRTSSQLREVKTTSPPGREHRSHLPQSRSPGGLTSRMGNGVSDTSDGVEAVRPTPLDQLLPTADRRAQGDLASRGELPSTLDHRFAGVCCRDLKALQSKTDSKLASSRRTVHHSRTWTKLVNEPLKRLHAALWGQLRLGNEPLIHLSQRCVWLVPHRRKSASGRSSSDARMLRCSGQLASSPV